MIKQMLGLRGVLNARQLGGYAASDGRHIKDGVLLRSGLLFNVTQEDIALLRDRYELHTVIDLRTDEERAQKPDPVIDGVRNISLPILDEAQNAGNQMAIVEIYRLYGANPGKAYVEMVRADALSDTLYTSFFDSETSIRAVRGIFDVLLEAKKGAVLLHCTGGKDRAGIACMSILAVLGVDEQTILADFALTNEALKQNVDRIVAAASAYTADPYELEQVAALAGVSMQSMQSLFEHAKAENGSMLAFIQQKIGLTAAEIAVLRDMYLE